MGRVRVIGVFLVASSVAHAVSLAGWWRALATASPPQFVEVTQTGDTVTIPVTLSSFAGQLTGTITGVGEFNLTGVEARYDSSGVLVNDAASGKFKARAAP
jgi:hypothetical protein